MSVFSCKCVCMCACTWACVSIHVCGCIYLYAQACKAHRTTSAVCPFLGHLLAFCGFEMQDFSLAWQLPSKLDYVRVGPGTPLPSFPVLGLYHHTSMPAFFSNGFWGMN